MGARKTEKRIPANFTAADLGQTAASSGGQCTLVSFITSPLVTGRENTYVLFVTDAGIASSAQTFQWSFVENGGAPTVRSSTDGEMTYTPAATGNLQLTVKVLGAGNAELAQVVMSQSVVARNAELETRIANASGNSGAGIGNPDAARELINDHNPYYQAVTLQTPESGEGFKCFVFNMVMEGAMRQTPARRKQHLDQLAASLNQGLGDFAALAAEGAGVCGIRLALLAMSLGASPPIPWTELPDAAAQRALPDQQLRTRLAGLDENMRIDLFNLTRFPKSNITLTAKIVEGLRNRYFAGTNFSDVMSGMSGTRAHWIMRHFREGPIQHT